MGDNVNRALTLGVGIFVTLILVSGIITIFTQMRDIYGNVNKSNTSLLSSFDEFSQYNYTEKTGLDVINCANKYYNKDLVVVIYKGQIVNTDSGLSYINQERDSGALAYDELYLATVEEIEYNGVPKTTITFTKK